MTLHHTVYRIISIILAIALYSGANAQVYHDMLYYDLYGTLAPDATQSYVRLPDSLANKVRESLWNLGENSAGMSVRFATDASDISAKWYSLNTTKMNHMCPTGIRGLDLYTLSDGEWTFVGSAIPSSGEECRATIVKGMPKQMREYMLFLPLYDGIYDLQIGVNKGATFSAQQVDLPRRDKPVVMYGTSIMQGGCASRPGMAHSNILQRMLNTEVVNLGFSGNGHLDIEIAELMAQKDAGVYVIDVLPNNTKASLEKKLAPFYDVLRSSHPTTPILLVESPIYPRAKFDKPYRQGLVALNAALRSFYDSRRNAGDKYIYYFEGDKILDPDMEGSVDGVHFTDLGFQHFAQAMYPLLLQILNN